MEKDRDSYKQILKSTSLFGGSQLITIIIGIIRNKVIAILLGTTGIGLIGIYQSILDTIKSLSTIGIETSGVRFLAKEGNDESNDLSKKIALIDRWSIILGLLSSVICILFATPIKHYFFDDSISSLSIISLSISLFFMILAAGQTVVLQSLRKISYMVKSSIVWNLIALIISIPIYFYLKFDGIILVFTLTGIAMFLSAYYYRYKLDIRKIKLTLKETQTGGKKLFTFGIYIACASIPSTASLFIVKSFLTNSSGLDSVGIFQAAWVITNTYLSLILKSMGTDFYPRLCRIIVDKTESKRLINEQTYIGLLFSIPAITFILLTAKILLSILYSGAFENASSILNWQIIGSYLKIMSWPLGFILLAKGKGLIFFATELIYYIAYVMGIKLLYPIFDIEAVGISYFTSYLIYLVVVYLLAYKLIAFTWSKQNLKHMLFGIFIIAPSFLVVHYYETYSLYVVVPLFITALFISVSRLNKIFPVKEFIENKIFKKTK